MSYRIQKRTLGSMVNPDTGMSLRVSMIRCKTGTHDIDRLVGAIEDAVLTTDVVVCPEYSFLMRNGPMDIEELNIYFDIFREMSESGVIIPGTMVWKKGSQMRSTLYVFYDKRIVACHDKVPQPFDRKLAKEYGLYAMASKGRSYFEVYGCRFGAEICHENDQSFRHEHRNLDALFVVSSGKRDIDMCRVRPGGYGILVDGDGVNLARQKLGYKDLYDTDFYIEIKD